MLRLLKCVIALYSQQNNQCLMYDTMPSSWLSRQFLQFLSSLHAVLSCPKLSFFNKFFQSVKGFGSSSGQTFCPYWPLGPSVHTFCLSGTISQYLLVRFDSFLVQMISTMNSRYPISLVKMDPLTLELLPLFSICNYKAKPILTFFV